MNKCPSWEEGTFEWFTKELQSFGYAKCERCDAKLTSPWWSKLLFIIVMTLFEFSIESLDIGYVLVYPLIFLITLLHINYKFIPLVVKKT